jgi:putative cell wall-binding protein
VLLVTHDAIPAAIGAELTRLKPGKIVVLGGTGAIDAGVRTALAGYSANVVPLSGADRYGTSAAVAGQFPVGGSPAYIATGTTFSDGLSAASAAGSLNAPVLLVSPHAIPADVAAALTRLQPTAIIVIGGTGAVDNAVQAALGAYVH